MKKEFKKIAAMVLAGVLLLTGCGATADNPGGSTVSQTGTGKDYALTLADLEGDLPSSTYDFYSRDTLELTIMTIIGDPYSKDATLIEEIEKATNTKITVEWQSADNYQERIGSKLATEQLPDIIGRVPDLNYVKQQEVAYPLEALLKEYAPDYVNALSDTLLLETTDTETGAIYTMSSVRQIPDGYTYMIRTDWLERVGKDVPTTWDEFVDVLRAFKKQDANGDGDPNNEIPLACDITHLRFAFGINGRYNFCVENGEYKPVAYHSNYKAYCQAMQELYAEGLLDKEYATRDVWSSLLTAMDSNMVGCTVHFAERAKLDTEALREAGFDGQFEGIAPIAGPYGDKGLESQSGGIFNFCISADVDEERAIELVRFLNFFYTEEGIRLMNYGVEGKHYDMVDGAPTVKSEYADILQARKAGLIFQPLNFLWLTDSYMQMVMGGLSVENMSETQKIYYDALMVNQGVHVDKCPGLTTEAWNDLRISVEPAFKTFEANVVCGNISMDDFDAELEKLTKLGLGEIAEEAAAAYRDLSK